MNPDQPSREQIEGRLTALLLGELPAAEAELLRWTISKDPELQKLHDQLKATIGFVREAMKNPTGAPVDRQTPLKLPQDRRQTLLAHFKTSRPQKPELSWLRRIEIPSARSFVVAAIIVLFICGLAAISIPNFVKARATTQVNACINNLRQIEAAKNEWALETGKSPNDVPTANDLTPYLQGQVLRSVAGENYVLGKVSEPAMAELNGKWLTAMPGNFLSASMRSPHQIPSTGGGFGPLATTISGSQTTIPALRTPPTPAPIALPNTESSQTESPQPDGAVYSQSVVGYVNINIPTGNVMLAANQLDAGSVQSFGSARSSSTILGPNQGVEPNTGLPEPAPKTEQPGFDFAGGRSTRSQLEAQIPPSPAGGTYATADDGGVVAANWHSHPQPNSASDLDRVANGPYEQKEIRNGALSTNYLANAMPMDQPAFISRESQNADNIGQITSGPQAVPPVSVSPVPRLPRGGSPELPPNSPDQNRPFASRLQNALTSATNGTPWAAQYFNFPDGASDDYVTNTVAMNQAGGSDWSANDLHLKAANIGLANGGVGPSPRGQAVNQFVLRDANPSEVQSVLMGTPASAARANVVLPPQSRQQYAQSQLQGKFQIEQAPRSFHQASMPVTPPQANAPIPQPEILTSDNAFSTFSLNVSDVSFKLAMASLEKGRMPAPASIRSEEFINAFDYHDPEPLQGEPLAFVSERARDPFAQERDFLRFSIKAAAAGRQDGRALNLVILLDTSGSMERADRVVIIREMLRVLSTQLQPHDVVSVVTFARTARLWADGIPGDEAGATLDKVGSITPEGGTNLEEAMRLAYETALRHFISGGMNRVVLLTDGAANLGNVDPQTLTQKVDAERRQGIALDCFGIGWDDYNDDLLEQLSSNGDGRYAFINSPDEAATEFAAKLAGALQVAAEDVKVQVEFNPNRVTAWRQIGYAKHQLTKQQFRDNSIAAGAIAAREAGNALYAIETNPDGQGPIATVRVRYRVPGTQDVQERSWLVEYSGDAPELAQSSPAMRLAVTAAEISEWLAASPFAQNITPDELLNYLSGVPQFYGTDDRPKQLEWMIRQADTLSR